MSTLHLTKCEQEVMDVVWRLGRATVQDVCDALARPLAYTTVMTTLSILHRKRGVLRRTKQGRAYAYEPTVSREDVWKSVAGELKEHLFCGSVKSLVLSLIDEKSMTKRDIHELKAAIEALESEK